jgi:murein DD-endopeptidase MepM/ murein hydrolase activator NlpD
MSRTSILSLALAVLALGVGAMGYATTGRTAEGMRLVGPERAAIAEPVPAAATPRPADRAIEVGGGEPLVAALRRAGVGGLDAALAEQVGSGLSGRVELWLGESVGRGARTLERLAVRTGPGRLLILERQGDGFVRSEIAEAVDLTPVRIRLAPEELATGLVEAGLPRALRHDVLDHVAGQRLAALDLIVAHEAAASGSRYGAPLYLGLHLADGGIRHWVRESGHLRPISRDEGAPTGLLRPLPGPVTSNPGLRFHPILRYLRWHRGTDFASPAGTPVQAALGGRVIAAGWHGGYGRAVRIAHADGSTTLYAHLSAIEVNSGQAVPQGAVVGMVGTTGLATGPHLHFEWQKDGATLRPAFGGVQVVARTPGAAQRASLQALLSAPFRLPPRRS